MLDIILEATKKINFTDKNQSISDGHSMLQSFEQLAALISEKIEKNQSIKFETKHIALFATKPFAEKSLNILFNKGIDTVKIHQIDFEDNITTSQNSNENFSFLGSIYIQKEVLQEKILCTDGLFSYYIEENDFLFQQSKTELISNVLGVSCGKHKIENLTQTVELAFPYKINQGQQQNELQDNALCSYWQPTGKNHLLNLASDI